MTQVTDSKATATLSGRELALKRRKAMAMHGKAATASAASVRAPATPSARTAVPTARPGTLGTGPRATEVLASAASARMANRARREALSAGGKTALSSPVPAGDRSSARPVVAGAPKSCGCGCNGTQKSCNTSTETTGPVTSSPVADEMAIVGQTEAGAGRMRARARRSALAQEGKAGLASGGKAASSAATPSIASHGGSGVGPRGNGRDVAQARRLAQSLAGSAGVKKDAARATGRVRAPIEAPVPAQGMAGRAQPARLVTGTMAERGRAVTGDESGASRTLTGTGFAEAPSSGPRVVKRPAGAADPSTISEARRNRSVTGTLVGGSDKVTGNESGATRAVTGTEYGAASQGAGVPSKVAVTHTSQGKAVTGTAVGHSEKTTGDERGACRGVTGIQYLSMEAFTRCGTSAPSAPRKVSVMSSRGEQPISGTGVGRSENVTGDEPGACRQITGSQYSAADGALCQGDNPRKVSTMQTLAGRTVTGSEMGPSRRVTGDDKGGCKPVTGTQYVGSDQQADVCDTAPAVSPVAKVAVDQTWRGQPVTGSHVGRSATVTGDEQGGCAPISGTPYIGRSQYDRFCEKPAAGQQEARIKESALIPATAVTGDRPGAGGSVMTGDERGACEVVSGTPYVGADNTMSECATSGRFVTRTSTWVEPERAAAPTDFSITSPARAARQKTHGDVTGAAYHSERITGPVNKAGGLITGTPEFRHHDATRAVDKPQEIVSAARRLTGEGSQAGRQVTGDAWHAMSRVTGTEGLSSQVRNPSTRGNPRGMGMSAARFRGEVEPTPVPPSRITGSAGNAGNGALITLSGGARG